MPMRSGKPAIICDMVISSNNERLNDLVFASDLFKKVKKVETDEHDS